jgi:hypothetical protein
MMRPIVTGSLLFLALLVGCGGSHTDAKDPGATSAEADASSGAPADTAKSTAHADDGVTPDTCETKGNECLPAQAYVRKLCDKGNSDAALYLFRKGSPFTRGYVNVRTVDAVNASGGASSNDQLVFDEEVIVLTRRVAQAGGIQVSGSGGSVDVLRWDGTCASLQPEELTLTPAPKPKHAKIDFHGLADATQQVLLKDDKLSKTNSDRRKECKGVTMGDVSAKCAKLVDQLGELVVDYVRDGGTIPVPAKIP